MGTGWQWASASALARISRTAALLAVIGVVVGSCAARPSSRPDERARGMFIYAYGSSFPNLDPTVSYSNGLIALANCYETLTSYDARGPSGAPGRSTRPAVVPALATHWHANDTADEWTFALRRGVVFHDGTPLNAVAVKYSIDKIREVGLAASHIWDCVSRIEVVDEHTVRFELHTPAPLDLIASATYSAWIFSPSAFEKVGPAGLAGGQCAGTGPYTFESYEPGARLVMTRNERYWRPWRAGQFRKVVYLLNVDTVMMQQMIEAGTVSFAHGIPEENVALVAARSGVTLHATTGLQNLTAFLNTRKPPLDDARVRRALAHTFPYDQIISAVMLGRARRPHGPVPAGVWGHVESLPQPEHDLARARALLARAGQSGAGLRLLYTHANGDMVQQQAGELWKAELAKLGIELEVRGLRWEAQWALARSRPEAAQDIFVMYWWPDYVSPRGFLESLFHSEPAPLFNLSYFRSDRFDRLLEQANGLAGVRPSDAVRLYGLGQRLLIEQTPALFLADMMNSHLVRSDIEGYRDNPAYPHVVFVYDLRLRTRRDDRSVMPVIETAATPPAGGGT